MGSVFHDPPVFYDNDLIKIKQTIDPVGNDNRGFVVQRFRKISGADINKYKEYVENLWIEIKERIE